MQAEDLALLLTREMPFGKYKGRVIADLPGDYLAEIAERLAGTALQQFGCGLARGQF